MQMYFSLPMATKMKVWVLSSLMQLASSAELVDSEAVPQDLDCRNFKGYSLVFDSNIDSANNDKGDFRGAFDIRWEVSNRKRTTSREQMMVSWQVQMYDPRTTVQDSGKPASNTFLAMLR